MIDMEEASPANLLDQLADLDPQEAARSGRYRSGSVRDLRRGVGSIGSDTTNQRPPAPRWLSSLLRACCGPAERQARVRLSCSQTIRVSPSRRYCMQSAKPTRAKC
jgi:hypothetical protein